MPGLPWSASTRASAATFSDCVFAMAEGEPGCAWSLFRSSCTLSWRACALSSARFAELTDCSLRSLASRTWPSAALTARFASDSERLASSSAPFAVSAIRL